MPRIIAKKKPIKNSVATYLDIVPKSVIKKPDSSLKDATWRTNKYGFN